MCFEDRVAVLNNFLYQYNTEGVVTGALGLWGYYLRTLAARARGVWRENYNFRIRNNVLHNFTIYNIDIVEIGLHTSTP